MNFTEKIVVVTGGSRGIGQAIVLQFLLSGAKVHYLSRTKSSAHDEMLEKAELNQTLVEWHETDVTKEESITQALDTIVAEFGRVNVLVKNAGITRDGLIMRMKDEDWREVLDSNLTSAFIASRKVVRTMLKAPEGVIINVSSIVGLHGNAGQTNYSASKAGLIGFSKSLAKEVASRGVRVNVVAPGYVDTDMTKSLFNNDEIKQALIDQIPLRRVGKVEEIASVICFLASDTAAYITGQVLQIDGGLAI